MAGKLTKLEGTAMEQFGRKEGYSYEYDSNHQLILILSVDDRVNTYEIMGYDFIKTTWIAMAIHELLRVTEKQEITITKNKVTVTIEEGLGLINIIDALWFCDIEGLRVF